LLESTLERTRLNLTQKAANTMMHRKNEHHYRGMQHMKQAEWNSLQNLELKFWIKTRSNLTQEAANTVMRKKNENCYTQMQHYRTVRMEVPSAEYVENYLTLLWSLTP
jgi:hypothetical protein